ncbi:hypothetical protein [Herbiconiux sp. L3-i23]|nr:hypothetical protein [Herbiconiux sp. L3-i23]
MAGLVILALLVLSAELSRALMRRQAALAPAAVAVPGVPECRRG